MIRKLRSEKVSATPGHTGRKSWEQSLWLMPSASLCKAASQMRFPGDSDRGPLGKKQVGVPKPSGASSPASSLTADTWSPAPHSD